MPLSQRRQGSAQQAHNTDAASAAAVSFLIGGSALNEACDILCQQSAHSSASCPQPASQTQNNEDHCQKLAALYQKGKAAYNIICRADTANTALSSDIMSIMTPGNAPTSFTSAGGHHSSQSSLSATANNTPLPRCRGSFTTPHGNKSKMTPGGLIHRKRSSMEGGFGGNGGRIVSRSLSDTSDVSNNNGAPGSGNNNNSNRGRGKSATNASASKKQQQQQQKPRKANPPPEVLNFLKALNAGGSKAAPASTLPLPPSSSSTTTAGVTSNNIDSKATVNSRKRPSASSAPKQSNKKRAPPTPPPSRRRQSSRLSNDDEHEEPDNEEPTRTTRRTRSKRRGASSINDNNDSRVYDIGESVFVQVDGKHYNAIVKNVDFKADEDDPDYYDNDDDATKIQRPVYEVEFSDGEVMEDVGGDDVHSADEEGW